MLAVSRGRLICLSTPFGRRGFFWDAWARGGDDWQRIEIPASKCPRITPAFLDEERRALGESCYRQEFECSFESVEGLVYPDFARCVVPKYRSQESGDRSQESGVRGQESEVGGQESEVGGQEAGVRNQGSGVRDPWSEVSTQWRAMVRRWEKRHLRRVLGNAKLTRDDFPDDDDEGRRLDRLGAGLAEIDPVGGIDFGFRNPFAAVWGFVDRDGVLWLVGEHYARQKPLCHHAQFLPHNVLWYADPSGATERSELRCADFVVREGNNELRAGIAAVTARLQNGTLRILEGACPNLLAEAGLYRWAGHGDFSAEKEKPVDEHNHALAALRYLVSRLDRHRMARAA
jgi:hypothetical protein